MAFQARDVMRSASTTLQDNGAVRWIPTELLDYLNDGIREIVAIKPNATTKTITLTMVAGTLQTLPDEYTILSDVTRNLTLGHDDVGGPVGGGAVRPIKRTILDAQIPGWQDSASLPFSKKVVHVIYDQTDPRHFYVAPGNDGTGKVEAIVGFMPASITVPANVLVVEDYTAEVPMPDIYRNALVDFILHRAFAKDGASPGAAQRSVAHREKFMAALASIAQAEADVSLSSSWHPPAPQ